MRPAAIVVLLALFSMCTPTALAHESQLQSTVPSDGAQVTHPITQLVARYSGPAQGATALVVKPNGEALDAVVSGRGAVVRIAVDVDSPGRYEVRWRVPQADGHEIASSSSFTATPTAVTKEPAPSTSLLERLIAWLLALLGRA